MNGREALKLMADGKMVINSFMNKYKIDDYGNLVYCGNNGYWSKTLNDISYFINSNDFKEYEEPVTIKRKCLIVGENLVHIDKSFKGSQLYCTDISNCYDLDNCKYCPLENDMCIDSTDERIKEIKFEI